MVWRDRGQILNFPCSIDLPWARNTNEISLAFKPCHSEIPPVLSACVFSEWLVRVSERERERESSMQSAVSIAWQEEKPAVGRHQLACQLSQRNLPWTVSSFRWFTGGILPCRVCRAESSKALTRIASTFGSLIVYSNSQQPCCYLWRRHQIGVNVMAKHCSLALMITSFPFWVM